MAELLGEDAVVAGLTPGCLQAGIEKATRIPHKEKDFQVQAEKVANLKHCSKKIGNTFFQFQNH